MLTVEETIAAFPQIVGKKAYRITDEEQILQAIEKAESFKFDKPGRRWESLRKRKSQVLLKLAHKYVACQLSQHFPILDNSLFEMPRYFKVAIENTNSWRPKGVILADSRVDFNPKPMKDANYRKIRYAKGTLFAYTDIDFDQSDIRAEVAELDFGRRNRLRIRARMPGMLEDKLWDSYALAKRRYYETMAKVYSMPKLADLMNLDADNHWDDNESGEIGVMWIPTRESLEINVEIIPRPHDPAMILRVYDHNFLIKMWNVEHEEPFEHLIREFSLGELPPMGDDD